MIYLKEYNSFESEESRILGFAKECLIDFTTDYSMKIMSTTGIWDPEFGGFLDKTIWNDVIRLHKVDDLEKRIGCKIDEVKKCTQLSILNEHLGSGRSGKLEIPVDNESNVKFIEGCLTLKSVLSHEIDLFDLIYPKSLSNQWYQITIYVIYT